MSEEKTTAPPAGTSRDDLHRGLGEALPAERLDVAVRERATAMETGSDLRTAVRVRRVAEREPDRQVLLRLDVGVAVVLVPREAARLLGLLVDGLVPVEVHVRADEVRAEVDEGRMATQRGELRRACHEVRAEGDGAGLGDHHAAALDLLERGVDLGLEAVGLGDHLRQQRRLDEIGHHDEAVRVELAHLLREQAPEGARPGAPFEAVVPGMTRHESPSVS